MVAEAGARAGRMNLIGERRVMKLYFLRHAEAEDAPVDDGRRLTGKGRKDARRLGRYFRKTGVAWDLVFTSPLVRAVETAAQVLKECPQGGKVRPVEVEVLRNGATAAGFFRWLRGLPEAESVLLVGHEPSLSGWVRKLIGVEGAEALPLAKASVARVDTADRRKGTLRLLTGAKFLA